MESGGQDARIDNERAFHNERFTHEVRDAQAKYYASISHGSALFERKVLDASRNADVLEYGCGAAIQGVEVSAAARSVTGIDISDVAVRSAQESAENLGLHNVEYHVMNAEDLTFADASFDLVFGRGIIHHLDLEKAYENVLRVLRPGGRALFWEPLGHNPIINRYRNMTPDARTPDEHPLRKSDIDLAARYFEVEKLSFFGLTTILSVPVRNTDFGELVLRTTSVFDRLIFRSSARWMAWHILIELRKGNA